MQTSDLYNTMHMQPQTVIMVTAGDLRQVIDRIVKETCKEMAEEAQPKYYTGEELQQVLGVSSKTVYNWAKRGLLLPIKVANRVYYDRKAVHDMMRKQCKYT